MKTKIKNFISSTFETIWAIGTGYCASAMLA